MNSKNTVTQTYQTILLYTPVQYISALDLAGDMDIASSHVHESILQQPPIQRLGLCKYSVDGPLLHTWLGTSLPLQAKRVPMGGSSNMGPLYGDSSNN